MKVILLQDVDKLGKKNDLKDVADGYAKNFLIPQKLAKIASKQSMDRLEKEQQEKAKKAEKELQKAQETVGKVDGTEIVVPVKLTKTGKVYGSVTPTKIAKALKAKGFAVKKAQVGVEGIKELGEHPVKISFSDGLEADITVNVIEEEE